MCLPDRYETRFKAGSIGYCMELSEHVDTGTCLIVSAIGEFPVSLGSDYPVNMSKACITNGQVLECERCQEWAEEMT